MSLMPRCGGRTREYMAMSVDVADAFAVVMCIVEPHR